MLRRKFLSLFAALPFAGLLPAAKQELAPLPRPPKHGIPYWIVKDSEPYWIVKDSEINAIVEKSRGLGATRMTQQRFAFEWPESDHLKKFYEEWEKAMRGTNPC